MFQSNKIILFLICIHVPLERTKIHFIELSEFFRTNGNVNMKQIISTACVVLVLNEQVSVFENSIRD